MHENRMDGIYYGDGSSSASGMESSVIRALSQAGMDPKDLSTILTILSKMQGVQDKSASNTMGVDQAILNGTYAPPPVQDFPEWIPTWVTVEGWKNHQLLAEDDKTVVENNPIRAAFEIVSDLNSVPADPATAVSRMLANAQVVAYLSRMGIEGKDNQFKYLDTNYRQALNEREANLNSYKKWTMEKEAFNRQQQKDDPFLSRGLPSVYETYGLEADPERGVQQLPMDAGVGGLFAQKGQEFEARDAARPESRERPNTSQGVANAFFGKTNQVQPSDARSLRTVQDLYMKTKLAEAQQQGRTPLVDNLNAKKRINNDPMSVIAALLGGQ